MKKFMDVQWWEESFLAHEPKPENEDRYATINEAAREFARVIAENAPEYSNETRFAVYAVQEAALWAREAIRTYRSKPGVSHASDWQDADEVI